MVKIIEKYENGVVIKFGENSGGIGISLDLLYKMHQEGITIESDKEHSPRIAVTLKNGANFILSILSFDGDGARYDNYGVLGCFDSLLETLDEIENQVDSIERAS